MNMKICIPILFLLFSFSTSYGQTCLPPTAITEFEPNEVRTTLSHGGSLWWDKDNAGFAIPKQDERRFDVHAFYAGGLWIGGLDPGGNLKLAAATYGQAAGRVDYWAGPLDSSTGATEPGTCANWDKFFKVNASDVNLHRDYLQQASSGSFDYTPDLIPESIKAWPANGNPYFESSNGFALPANNTSFTEFHDENGNGTYEPLEGDYPALIQQNCNVSIVPAEMVYWVFNDNADIHRESQGDAIQAEFHAIAFAFNTGNSLDYTQFYKYRLVNRAVENITETRIGLWADPDLGCYTDDYFGCDTTRSLMYVYNEDAEDGSSGFFCPGGINTYAEVIPIVGIDMLGINSNNPNNSIRPMDAFSFYDASSPINPRPTGAIQFWNLMNGLQSDGQPLLNAAGDPTSFAYYDPPNCNTADCWSMCSTTLPQGDRRTVMSTGQFTLVPGEEIEIFFANVFAPNQNYPCPDLTELLAVDDLVQAAYDNCFQGLTSTVEERPLISQLRIFPNPVSKNQLSISFEGLKNGDQLVLSNTLGQMQSSIIATGQEFSWNLNNDLKKGLYFVSQFRNQTLIGTGKLIVHE
jgi:hypothetical protein